MLEQPYALTLWTFYQITERERIHALRKRIEVTDNAVLTAMAFNDPPKLTIEQQAARDAAKASPRRDDVADTQWRERAARLVASIEGGKVLEDGVNA